MSDCGNDRGTVNTTVTESNQCLICDKEPEGTLETGNLVQTCVNGKEKLKTFSATVNTDTIVGEYIVKSTNGDGLTTLEAPVLNVIDGTPTGETRSLQLRLGITLQEGDNITIEGAGTDNDPYVISSSDHPVYIAGDHVTITGVGTPADPYVINSIQATDPPLAGVTVAPNQLPTAVTAVLSGVSHPNCPDPGILSAAWTLKDNNDVVLASGADLPGNLVLPDLTGEANPFTITYTVTDTCGQSAEVLAIFDILIAGVQNPTASVDVASGQAADNVQATITYTAHPECPTPGLVSASWTLYDGGDNPIQNGATTGSITLSDLTNNTGPFRLEAAVTDACGTSTIGAASFTTLAAKFAICSLPLVDRNDSQTISVCDNGVDKRIPVYKAGSNIAIDDATGAISSSASPLDICALDAVTEQDLDNAQEVHAAMCVDGEVVKGPFVHTSSTVDLVLAETTLDARFPALDFTNQLIPMDTVTTDSFGLVDIVNDQFIADRDGYWTVEFTGGFNGNPANIAVNEVRFFFRVNEGLPSQRDWPLIAQELTGAGQLESNYSVGRNVPLLAGDTVRFMSWFDTQTGGTTEIGWSDQINNAFMSILFIGNIV